MLSISESILQLNIIFKDWVSPLNIGYFPFFNKRMIALCLHTCSYKNWCQDKATGSDNFLSFSSRQNNVYVVIMSSSLHVFKSIYKSGVSFNLSDASISAIFRHIMANWNSVSLKTCIFISGTEIVWNKNGWMDTDLKYVQAFTNSVHWWTISFLSDIKRKKTDIRNSHII